jgi:hypothetical protein
MCREYKLNYIEWHVPPIALLGFVSTVGGCQLGNSSIHFDLNYFVINETN